MAIVLPPVKWRLRKGLQQNVKDALRAMRRTVHESWAGTTAVIGRHWREESVLALGLVVVVLLKIENPPTQDLPLLLAALVPPVCVFAAAVGVVFFVLLIQSPFLDHRKLVWELEQADGKFEAEKASHAEELSTARSEFAAERAALDRELMKERLSLALVDSLNLPQRIERLREAEALKDDRARARTTAEASVVEPLREMIKRVSFALEAGGRIELVTRLPSLESTSPNADALGALHREIVRIAGEAIHEASVQ